MQKDIVKAIAAGAVVGILGVSGMQLANAQEDPTTSTTVEESTDSTATTDTTVDDSTADDESTANDDSTAAEDENCPNMGGDRTGGHGPSSDTSATDSDTSVDSSSL